MINTDNAEKKKLQEKAKKERMLHLRGKGTLQGQLSNYG